MKRKHHEQRMLCSEVKAQKVRWMFGGKFALDGIALGKYWRRLFYLWKKAKFCPVDVAWILSLCFTLSGWEFSSSKYDRVGTDRLSMVNQKISLKPIRC